MLLVPDIAKCARAAKCLRHVKSFTGSSFGREFDVPLHEPKPQGWAARDRQDTSPTYWGAQVSGKADAAQQILETRVVAQSVHARIYMKIDKPVRMFFVGFLEVFNSTVVFA